MHPILFHCAFLRAQTIVSAQDPNQFESNGRLRRWLRVYIGEWKYRRTIAALNELDDRSLKDIGIQRGHIKRIADRLTGVDSQISGPTGVPADRSCGQSRLMRTS